MPVGALVAIPELQAEGVARLLEAQGTQTRIRFLASGAEKVQPSRQIVRYALLPGTEVTVGTPPAARRARVLAQGLRRDAATGLLVYAVGFLDEAGGEGLQREDALSAVALPLEPAEQLAQAAFHELRPAHDARLPPEAWGAPMLCAREALLAWRDRAWSDAGGVVALSGARVVPLPHQLITARRVLADRQVRFLLADEVGLGKTIEAGLIMQSLLALRPTMRVLVLAPGALLSQWFLELYVKFGGRSFLMLDRERMEDYAGNPWKDEQFLLASHRVIEELEGVGALRLAQSSFDLVIVDECHRMQPGGALFKRVASLSRHAPHVLLLSATPSRQHARAYLALLSLLQPQVYHHDDTDGFAAKLEAHAAVTATLAATMGAQDAELRVLARRWRELLGADPQVVAAAQELERAPSAGGREALVAHVREHHQLDARIIRHRRSFLAAIPGAGASLAQAVRSVERISYAADEHESALRAELERYRAQLVGAFAGAPPPRLAHWLLQVQLAGDAHVAVLERLLAMRATVLENPAAVASYRARVIAGETLADVLRSDLSEEETLAHITASAACHADIPGEAEAVARLRELVITRRSSARVRALIQRLKRYWKDNAEEKVLVFTAQPLALAPLSAMLQGAFGAEAITTFGAHQDPDGREEAARRFRDDPRCWAMVCDPLGGEGRNFQFVSVVVHHDLPWSLSAVEQRIGRVDRIGRDGDVPSWVLASSDQGAVEAAWADVLERAVGVFTGPSSGLEFVADAIETAALTAALAGGAAALRAKLPELIALVAAERARDDAREEALYQREATAYAEAAAQAAAIARAEAPADAAARWLRSMGGSARRDEEEARVWQMRARHLDNPSAGTFVRDLALARPELGFLAVGHALIDRALDDAAGARWCAAQAWRRKAARGMGPWQGVRASFALEHDLAPLAAAGLPLECLRRLFTVMPPARFTICARSDGEVERDPAMLEHLARPFDARAGDTTFGQAASRDLWARLLAQGAVDQVTKWQEEARSAVAAARAEATRMLEALRAPAMATLSARFASAAAIAAAQAAVAQARLGAKHAETQLAHSQAEDERGQGEALTAAAAGARLTLASVAYLVVA